MITSKHSFFPFSCALLALCSCLWPTRAQRTVCDYIIPASGNALLENYRAAKTAKTAKTEKTAKTAKTEKPGSETSLSLPFFDDFSFPGPYPQAGLWEERNVFVNNTYPLFPPTYGVATFDGLDENGEIYAHARPGSSFWADTLTSRPINLSSYTAGDSIYLSFYYQPGGGYGDAFARTRRGVAPGESDRLDLEFLNPDEGVWTTVWSASGTNLSDFCPFIDSVGYPVQDQQYFRQVMVAVTSESYLKDKFRFRFRGKSGLNSSSESGGGQWHVDYVYLDTKRGGSLKTVADVAFVDVAPSLLKEYTEVPFRQFDESMLRSNVDFTLTNLSAQSITCRYRYEIRDEDEEILYNQPASGELSAQIYPFVNNGYYTVPELSSAPMDYAFPDVEAAAAPAKFSVRHILSSGIRNSFGLSNDTLVFVQNFGTDFAYDDGSAEAGWGLNYSDGAVAYAFNLKRPDTLTALRIFFNRSYNNANEVAFNIVVWGEGSADTLPGEVLYKEEDVSVAYGDRVNAFVTYVLSEPVLLPAGRFYVGIEQRSSTFLNIGFDQNAVLDNKIFYSYYNTFTREWVWMRSLYSGALMIRPAFGGAAVPEVSVEPLPSTAAPSPRLRIVPNPVKNGTFRVVLPEGVSDKDVQVSLFDLGGRMLWRKPYAPEFVTGAPEGVYMVCVTRNGRVEGVSKLVVL